MKKSLKLKAGSVTGDGSGALASVSEIGTEVSASRILCSSGREPSVTGSPLPPKIAANKSFGVTGCFESPTRSSLSSSMGAVTSGVDSVVISSRFLNRMIWFVLGLSVDGRGRRTRAGVTACSVVTATGFNLNRFSEVCEFLN